MAIYIYIYDYIYPVWHNIVTLKRHDIVPIASRYRADLGPHTSGADVVTIALRYRADLNVSRAARYRADLFGQPSFMYIYIYILAPLLSNLCPLIPWY